MTASTFVDVLRMRIRETVRLNTVNNARTAATTAATSASVVFAAPGASSTINNTPSTAGTTSTVSLALPGSQLVSNDALNQVDVVVLRHHLAAEDIRVEPLPDMHDGVFHSPSATLCDDAPSSVVEVSSAPPPSPGVCACGLRLFCGSVLPS